MRFFLLTLLTLHTANAADISIHNSSLFLSILFLGLGILIVYAYHVYKCKQKRELLDKCETELKEIKEKSTSLENDMLQKDARIEKEILELNHTIEKLKQQIQEGTKNQVVSKIEELERKRLNRQNQSLDS